MLPPDREGPIMTACRLFPSRPPSDDRGASAPCRNDAVSEPLAGESRFRIRTWGISVLKFTLVSLHDSLRVAEIVDQIRKDDDMESSSPILVGEKMRGAENLA